MCNNNGEWESIDFSGCTMRDGTTPIVLLEYNQSPGNANTSSVTSEVRYISAI